jgi:hypothetical protein
MTRAEIIRAWRAFLGVRRLHQGRNPASGLDCAGLFYCANQSLAYAVGVDAPAPYNTPEQTRVLDRLLEERWDELPVAKGTAGDLYLFHLPRHWSSHVALKTQEPDWFIHCYEGTSAVVEHPISEWLPYVVKVFAYRGVTD